jgi:DNA-directed RNA polymerase I subunit RPA1
MELDDKRSSMLMTAKSKGKTVTELVNDEVNDIASSSPSDPKLDTVMSYLDKLISPPVLEPLLTSHERSLQRSLIKSFTKLNGTYATKCNHCSALSNRFRQDAYNKIFISGLSNKSIRSNTQNRVKIVPAEQCVDASGEIVRDDDSDNDDDDDSGDDGDEDGNNGGKKPDKFCTTLEVIAQVKLTWSKNNTLCSRIFGSALDNTDSPWDIFFTRVIAVPPSRFRPPMVLGSMMVEHSQNMYLSKILLNNGKIREGIVVGTKDLSNDDTDDSEDRMTKAAASASNTLQTWIDLQLQVNCYYDSSKDPGGTASTAPPGIRQLLERKEGIFRKHMMGKRVNYACRSVISPDPYIGTNEIGVPLKFAKTLDYSTPVTQHNIEKMRNLVCRGPDNYPGANWIEDGRGVRYNLGKMSEVKREAMSQRLLSHEHGQMKVGRQLEDGDSMLVNRQVSSYILISQYLNTR